MKHIPGKNEHGLYTVDALTACGKRLTLDDGFTLTALESDCDDCRTAVGVGKINDRVWAGGTLGVRPVPKWEAEPMPDADDLIDDAKKRRE